MASSLVSRKPIQITWYLGQGQALHAGRTLRRRGSHQPLYLSEASSAPPTTSFTAAAIFMFIGFVR